MLISISAIFFYNENISKNFLTNIAGGIRHYLEKNTTDSIHLLITNNAFDTTIDADFHPLLKDVIHPAFTVEIINNDWNKGYGLAHNEAFQLRNSDIFIILNNDLTFRRNDWIRMFCLEIEKGYPLVGMRDAPNSLTPDGEGYESATKTFDYAEGSALAVKSEIARKHGLFAHDIRTAYFEDSDLSLRYRQLGLKISLISVPHVHLRGMSTNKFIPATLKTIRELNKSRFLSRWSKYLHSRELKGRSLFILDCIGWGDAISSLPAILNICAESPEIQFDLKLKLGFAECFFQGIPNLRILKNLIEDTSGIEKNYDRIMRFSDVRCASVNYLGREIAATMGTDFYPLLATEHLRKIAKNQPSTPEILGIRQDEKVAVFHLESLRSDFQGRGINETSCKTLLLTAKKFGYYIINIGSESSHLESLNLQNSVDLNLAGTASLQEITSLISAAGLFVGIDSGPLHLAQYLNVPTFAIFGATSPTSKILNWSNTGVFMDWTLQCAGCYHLTSNSFVLNRCIRLDEACVKKINNALLGEAFASFLKGEDKSFINALQNLQALQTKLSERELRIGYISEINTLKKALEQYESGTSRLFVMVKKMAKRIPGSRVAYVWLRSKLRKQ